MPALLLLFYLIVTRPPQVVCSLWLSTQPTNVQVAQACPPTDLTTHALRAVNLSSGVQACGHLTAQSIYTILTDCPAAYPLNEWMFYIETPPTEQVVCKVQTPNHPPTGEEITAQCPGAIYTEIRYMGEIPNPASQPASACPAASPTPDPASLSTSEPLALLAARLIWHGQIEIQNCPTLYTDETATAASECALQQAMPLVVAWQNQYDVEIIEAAAAAGIPADLLKRILLTESQMWPLWGIRPAGEIGLAQLTPNAADRYLSATRPEWYTLPEWQRVDARAALLAEITCNNCTLADAAYKERLNIAFYAAVLRSYGCAAGDWHAALVLWNGQPYADRILSKIGS